MNNSFLNSEQLLSAYKALYLIEYKMNTARETLSNIIATDADIETKTKWCKDLIAQFGDISSIAESTEMCLYDDPEQEES